jgi:ribonuclease HI
MSDTVEVWTDGACSGNSGPGALGACPIRAKQDRRGLCHD